MLDITAIDANVPLHTLEKGVFAMWEEMDVVIRDARASATAPVPRDLFFDRLRAESVDEIAVIGVAADVCVLWAVRD